jgi:2-oxoglutarate dehydrogenase E1 component
MADDARSLSNTALLETSFLYGANATFVEEMAARYARDPNSVDASWRNFFDQVRDDPGAAAAAVRGPSWYRPEIAQPQTTETTALLDGNWAGLAAKLEQKVAARLPGPTQDVQSAARDSVRA